MDGSSTLIRARIYCRAGRLYIQKTRVNDEATIQLEDKVKRIPNIGFLGIALVGLAASAIFNFRRGDLGSFIEVCVPSLLLFGLYNKMIKIEEEVLLHQQDQYEREPGAPLLQ